MIKATVKKLTENDNTFETKLTDIEFIDKEPEIGFPMRLLKTPTFGIQTSLVLDTTTIVDDVKTITVFRTINSIYELTILNKDLEYETN